MSAKNNKGMSRRSFFAAVAGSAAVAVPFGSLLVHRSVGATQASDPSARSAGGLKLGSKGTAKQAAPAGLPGLVPGTQIGRWTVEEVHPLTFGGVPVILSSARTGRFQVDVLKRDPEIAGVGDTRELSVFVSNLGNGSKSTQEEQGLGAMALARELLKLDSSPSRPELLTLRERHQRFPSGSFRVLS